MGRQWLPISTTRGAVKAAKARGVSKTARGKGGFWPAYQRAKGKSRLSEDWQAKRDAFVARHMAQVEGSDESLWKDGEPTRRHLALAVWAYSPHRKRLERYLRAEGYM